MCVYLVEQEDVALRGTFRDRFTPVFVNECATMSVYVLFQNTPFNPLEKLFKSYLS